MLLPKNMYGTLKAARAKAKKAADLVATKGVSLDEAIDAERAIDTHGHPALIVLLTSLPDDIARQQHFHPALLLSELASRKTEGTLTSASAEKVFREALSSNHGLLGLDANTRWMWSGIKPWEIPPERRSTPVRARINVPAARAFLERFAEAWEILDGEGDRYSTGVQQVDIQVIERGHPGFSVVTPTGRLGAPLWRVGGARGLLYNLGVPDQEMDVDRPRGGLRGLLTRHADIWEASE